MFVVDVFTLSVLQRHAVRDLHAAVDFVVLLFGCHDTAASSNFRSTSMYGGHTR